MNSEEFERVDSFSDLKASFGQKKTHSIEWVFL
jgi:hypothetical protein